MNTISREQYEALCDEVWHHNRLYFQESRPEISDDDYDRLLKQLEQIEAVHPEWISETSPTRRVGEKPLAGFADVEHAQPMLSLEKAFTKEEMQEFHSRLIRLLEVPELYYCAELKMDGLAISVTYEKGRFIRAVTRGDGKVGSDVTQNLKTLKMLPLRLASPNIPDLLEVRGEVFLPKKAFERMNREREEADLPLWANPRNAAAGSLKLLDPTEVAKRSDLSVVFYSIASYGVGLPKSQYQVHAFLADLGLPTVSAFLSSHFRKDFVSTVRVSSLEELMQFADGIKKVRAELPFDIDGIVIKVDDLDAYDRLGTTGKHPRGALAFKFSAEQAWTYVRDITVQVGRTGVLTPVAELEPVSLAGSRISRATLHNFEEVERKDVRPLDYVCIEKGGDVIPKVVSVDRHKRTAESEHWMPPKVCPSCQTPVVKDPHEVAWRCPNNEGCPEQVLRGLSYFVGKNGLDIEGLGERIVQQLIEKGFVRKASDIFALTSEKLAQLEGFKEKAIHNLLSSIEKAKKTSLATLIMALGIRHVGSQTADILARSAKSLERLMHLSREELLGCQGVGEKMASQVADFFANEENRQEVQKLLQLGLCVEELDKAYDTNHPFFDKTLVLTGTLESMPRQQAIAKIKDLGGRTADTVSKKVDYLIAGAEAGSKLEKAKKMGISILDESEFSTILNKKFTEK